MFAENSLLNIRSKLRKSSFDQPSTSQVTSSNLSQLLLLNSKKSTSCNSSHQQQSQGLSSTLADFKEKVLVKKRLLLESSSTATRDSQSYNPRKRMKKSVNFNPQDNKVHYFDSPSQADIQNAWMSEQESEQVRRDMTNTVYYFRSGGKSSSNGDYHDEYCLRGLEVHSNRVWMKSKVEQNKSFINLVLQQYEKQKQSQLQQQQHHQHRQMRVQAALSNDTSYSSNASFNDNLWNVSDVSRLSAMLSAKDAQFALEMGLYDARQALHIHTTNGGSSSCVPIVNQTTHKRSLMSILPPSSVFAKTSTDQSSSSCRQSYLCLHDVHHQPLSTLNALNEATQLARITVADTTDNNTN